MESPRFTLLKAHKNRKKDTTSLTSLKLPKLKVKYGPQTPILSHTTSSNLPSSLRNFHSQSPPLLKQENLPQPPQVNFLDLLIDKYEKSKNNNIDLASAFARPEEVHVYWSQLHPVGFIP